MRVLPVSGSEGHFDFWSENGRQIVEQVAQLPFTSVLCVAGLSEAASARDAILSVADSATESAAAHGGVAFVANAAERAGASVIDSAAAGAAVRSARAAMSTMVQDLSIFDAILAHDVEWLTGCDVPMPPQTWQAFFERPLWDGAGGIPEVWEPVLDRFEEALRSVELPELAERHRHYCVERIDWNGVQDWLFSKRHIDFDRLASSVPEEAAKAMEDSDWWCELLFRLVLEDPERSDLLDLGRRPQLEAALRRAVGAGESAEPQELALAIHGRHGRLAKRFEEITISPLWRAWVKAVHGPSLLDFARKITGREQQQQ